MNLRNPRMTSAIACSAEEQFEEHPSLLAIEGSPDASWYNTIHTLCYIRPLYNTVSFHSFHSLYLQNLIRSCREDDGFEPSTAGVLVNGTL